MKTQKTGTAALAAVAIAFLTAGAALAKSVPDSWLWPAEEIHRDGGVVFHEEARTLWADENYTAARKAERERLAEASDPVERAKLLQRFAARRREEFARHAGEGRYIYLLLEHYRSSVYGALAELRHARHLGRPKKKIKSVTKGLTSSLDAMQETLEKVGELTRERYGIVGQYQKFCGGMLRGDLL